MMFRMLYLLLAFALTSDAFLHISANAQERRLALIIANQDYPESIGKLQNTFQDAATMDIALTAAGFEVTTVKDAHAGTPDDGMSMEDAITAFELSINEAAKNGDEVVAFVYASMHGAAAEVGGSMRNFLVPANEEIASTGQLIRKGIRIDELVTSLSATEASGIIIVSDACRNEIDLSFNKSGTKGWVAEVSGPGVVLAYATAPGQTTPDDGMFAKVLAQEIGKPNRKASFSMLAALEQIARFRSFDGQPYMTSGGLPEWFCFNGCPDEDVQIAERDVDYEDWVRFNATGLKSAYATYQKLHPDGRFFADAARRISELADATPVSRSLPRSEAVSAMEQAAWDDVPAGSCSAYRDFIQQFPDGVKVNDALLRLATRRTIQEEVWTPEEKALRLYLFQDGKSLLDRDQAIQAAATRAAYEAEGLCMGFGATSTYRLNASRAEIANWDCSEYPSGFVCGGRGNAICETEVRGTVEREVCGGE